MKDIRNDDKKAEEKSDAGEKNIRNLLNISR